jgi:transposase
MRSRTKRTYDPEFKKDTLRLHESSGRTAKAIENELGLYSGAIKNWKSEFAKNGEQAFPGTGHLTERDEEMRKLRRENEILREERDILKKAAAIFLKRPGAGISS